MRLSTGYHEDLAPSYIYPSPAELHERKERGDLVAAAHRHPPTLLSRVGAFFAHFRLLSREVADIDDCDHLWPVEGAGRERPARVRRSRDPLLDLDLGSDDLYSGRTAQRPRQMSAIGYLGPFDAPGVRWAWRPARRGDDLDTLDGPTVLGSTRTARMR